MSLDRVATIWRNILAGGLLVLFVLFFIGGPDYYSPRHFKEMWNLGHILFFALLPYCVFSFMQAKVESFSVQCMLAILMSFVLGVLVELFQYDFQRIPDVQDVVRDVIGGFVGIFFLLPSRKTIRAKLLRILQAATVCLVALQVYPVLVAFADEYIAHSRLPVLSDFETPWEIKRWTGSAAHDFDDRVHFSGKRSMRVLLGTDKYSGVSLVYFPGNWVGARAFRFSVFNPSAEILPIVCRINDREHYNGGEAYDDRFNRSYELPEGWSTIEIGMDAVRRAPRGRLMDLKQIREIGIFAIQLPRPRVIYIDDVALVF